MAIQFNAYTKTPSFFLTKIMNQVAGGSRTIKVWPDTVPLPASAPAAASSLPAGHIIALPTANFTVGISGSSMVFTGGSLTAVTTAAGTFSWWALHSGDSIVISDSIGTTAGNILTVSNMTPGNGETIVFGLNLTVV